jgi:hypothetical protein
MGRAWTTGERTSRNAEAITVTDFVAFFHQYFGLANNPVPCPFAHERCRCRRYFMGGDGGWGGHLSGRRILHQHQAGAHE